ncbi:MAG: diphosphomevalonate decarboxylase [Oligoflexales bacterium]|nr:diphosphomevalonate decarboxylase [Oligoflexales bacterium]
MNKIYTAWVPTNIALIKYWGKQNEALQIPWNDSLSMSLSLGTKTSARVRKNKEHTFFFAGQERKLPQDEAFLAKPLKHLQYLAQSFGFKEKLEIHSENTFPAACGIASSASGLGALTLAAMACWLQVEDQSELEKQCSLEQLAQLSRLGSGSSCRSFWGGFVHWAVEEDKKSCKISQVLPAEHWPSLCDSVVLFSTEEKKISSSLGHKNVLTSPLFLPRLERIPDRLSLLLQALSNKNLDQLGPVIEDEALEMHAVMMTASPALFYWGEQVSRFLAYLRRKRRESQLPVYFTMDAGPNVHLIHEKSEQDTILKWVKEYDPTLQILSAEIGQGPSLVTSF